MSNFLNKIPVSPITSFGNPSVPNGSTIGTNFSILQTGGYMEVYTLSGLTYTIPTTTGVIEFSGNSIPIQFTKGSGSVFSPDVLTLNSDNISSGRRKLGMLVYVYETNKIYQFRIDNYDTLWNNATGATGPGGSTVVISNFGTTVKNNSAAGIALINAWTASTISGVDGYNDTNASWRVLSTGGNNGGAFTGGTVSGATNFTGGLSANTISATTYYNLPATPFLPLSGGTVTGATIFTNGLTANTISATTYQNLPATPFLPLSGGTVTGATIFTNGLTANTFSLSTTPNTNTTNTDVLTLNQSTGVIEQRSINSLTNVVNLVTVGLSGSTGVNYNSIKTAVDSITGASPTNTYVVKVGPGVFYEDPITMKSYVDVFGDSETNTIIQANNPNTSLIIGADQSMISDVQIQGCTGTSVAAVIYSSATTPQLNAIFYVENVRFGTNYTHAKTVGTGGGNCIMQCSNVKYGGYPFTIGFYVTNDGSGVGRMQLRNVTSTNGGVTTTTGLIFAKADQPGCAFIVNGCLLTKAVGTAAGTGFWVENGGSLRLTAVNFQRWETGIYAPQIGSAPSIEAIALNFENCTKDVNIVHSGATGKVQGTDNYLKTLININAPLYEVNQDPRIITVAKKGGDFTSIKSAVDSITGSSSNNRFLVSVGPGRFSEGLIDLSQKPYISVKGSDLITTEVVPNSNTQHIFKIGQNNEISFLSISGASIGYAGIYVYDTGIYSLAHKLSFTDCDTNIWVESNTQDTSFYGEFLDFNGSYSYGVKVIANNGYATSANMENYYNFPTGTGTTIANSVQGSGATLNIFVADGISNGVTGSTNYEVFDYASLNTTTTTSDGWDYSVRNPNIGGPCRFDIDSISVVNSMTYDISIEHPNTFGTFNGSASHVKTNTVSEDVYWSFLDIEDGEFDITRKLSITFQDGSHTDTSTLIFEGGTMGLMNGGTISLYSGLTVNVASGFGYLEKIGSEEIHRRIDWNNSQITLSPNTENYLYFSENSILSASSALPNNTNNIVLGRVVTNSSTVSFIDLSPYNAKHTSNLLSDFNRNALGPVYASGSIVTQNVTPFHLNISQGNYYFSENNFLPTGGTNVNFVQYYRTGSGGWVTSATTEVVMGYDDNSGTISPLPLSAFTKHTLYIVGEGVLEKYFLVLGQNQYPTLIQTENADLPTPPTFFNDAVTPIASIYIQQGTTGITQFEDIRPVIGFKAGGVNASSLHANLLGLSADDHTQYLLVNGNRQMAGNLGLGGNTIYSAGTINGVTIESHASRHKNGGDDEVATSTPTPSEIPKADAFGKLDGWISDASSTDKGLTRLSVDPSGATTPIAVGVNDPRFQKSITGVTNTSNTLSFSNVTGGTTNFTGLTLGSISATTISAGTISTSFTSGSVLFSNGTTIAQDNSNLFWDDTNNRLGIETNSPSSKLQINTNNLGTTVTDASGVILENNTPSVSIGATTQYSPSLIFKGSAWKPSTTTSDVASWKVFNSTAVQGIGSQILSSLNFQLSKAGGAYSNAMTLTNDQYGGTSLTFPTGHVISSTNGSLSFAAVNLSFSNSLAATSNLAISQNIARTSGLATPINISANINPTSGTGETNIIQFTGTINQTGGANGITRGLYVAPTITAAADFRAIENSVGKVCLNTTSGNTMIGTSTDAGFKLDVNGTARVSGQMTVGNIVGAANGNTIGSFNNPSAITFFSNQINYTSSYLARTGTVHSFTANQFNNLTSGQNSFSSFSNGFNPVSGTGIWNLISLEPTINQTGGANGITRGLYITPTLTAAADFRAIETTVGNVMLNTTSGNTLIGTSVNSGFKLDVSGTARFRGTSTELYVNTNNTINGNGRFLVLNAYASSSPFGILLSGGGTERARLVTDDASGNLIIQNTWNDYAIQFNTNGANERMRIVGPNGNVLIGTSVDTGFKLNVSGNTRINGGLTANTISATTYQNLPSTPFLPLSGGTVTGTVIIKNDSSPLIITTDNYNPGSSGNILYFSDITGSTNGKIINSRSNGGGFSGALILQQQNNGFVGVNTNLANPTLNYNLDVNGTFGATSVSATTYLNLPSSGGSFTGGTVSGATTFTNGLTANTISATTYLNLPSSGGSFTGGTVSGPTNFTNGLTANTISATTYQNLPSTTFTGGTVSGPTNFTGGVTANTITPTTIIYDDLDYLLLSSFRSTYNY